MYNISYFKENNEENLLRFMQENNFATLIASSQDNMPVATQIPFLIEKKHDKTTLYAHIMKHTTHYNALEKNNNALVLFTGPHCHVSASWYTNPLQGSTWNYCTVQARGKVEFTGEEELIDILKQLTNKYETNNSPARFECLPKEYIQQMLPHIVGIKIEVAHLENVFKLSQNRDEESRKNIINQLKNKGDCNSAKIAEMMSGLNNEVEKKSKVRKV